MKGISFMNKILFVLTLLPLSASLTALPSLSTANKSVGKDYLRLCPSYTFSGMKVASAYEATNGFEKAYDGDETSFAWIDRSSVQDGSYILLDLGDVYAVRTIHVHTGTGEDYASDRFGGSVGVSKDGSSYATIASFNTSSAALDQKASCGAYYARYIKLFDLSFPTWGTLREFGVDVLSKADFDASLTVSGMSTYGTELGEYAYSELDCLLDESLSTYAWFRHVSDANAYLELDLGKVVPLSSFELTQTKAKSTADYQQAGFTFSYSSDGQEYTEIGSYDGRYIEHSLPTPVQARYLRAKVNGTEGSSDLVVSSFRVNPTHPFSFHDLSLYSDFRPDKPLSHASFVSDSDEATFADFTDYRGENPYFEYDLGKKTSVSSLRLVTGKETGDKVTSLRVQAIADDGTMKDLGVQTSSDGLFEMDFSSPLTVSKFRFDQLPETWMTINEIDVSKCLDSFLEGLDALTCDLLHSSSVAEAKSYQSDLVGRYEKLCASEIQSLSPEDAAKYAYMVEYIDSIAFSSPSLALFARPNGETLSYVGLTALSMAGVLLSALFLLFRAKKN